MTSATQRYLKQQAPFRSPGEEVFLAVQIMADLLMEPWATYLRSFDISPAQYNVLRILRGAGVDGLWAGEIAARLITRSPDVTRLIDRLKRRGLVSRTTDPDDRRAVRVHITEAGKALLAPLDQKSRTMLRQGLKEVPESKIAQLRDRLNDVLEYVVP